MQKNIKDIVIAVLIVIIILLIIGLIVIISSEEKTKPKNTLKENEVANIKESSESVPNFSLAVLGSYDGTITDEDLVNYEVQMYEFDAGLEYFWGGHTVHLTGVKLNDVLDVMQIENFDEIIFNGSSFRSVTYDKDQLTDDMFLVFYNDGKLINADTNISLVAVSYQYKYSLEGITSIGFNTETEGVKGA